jgi:uncharacterized protein with GYD domain
MSNTLTFRCSGWTGGNDGACSMATFLVLASFTDKGISKVKDTIGRAEKFNEMAKKSGINRTACQLVTTRIYGPRARAQAPY